MENTLQNTLLLFVKNLNNTYLGPLLIILLLSSGLYFTIRLGFIQRYLFVGIKGMFSHKEGGRRASEKEGMTPFQALSTAIAAQLGTGNIIGVATAVVAGGPGAIFWLWVSIFFGMATNYAEAVLAQVYRTKTPDGHVIGGPAYYISKGLKSSLLAKIFAVASVLALGFMGTIVQTNSIALTVTNVYPIEPIYVGLFVAFLVGSVLIGGITRIASFAEKIVPIMASVYFIAGITLILLNIDHIAPAFQSILSCAFSAKSVGGGALGVGMMQAIRYGVSRGLFSNEAGLGTTPHAHAVAKVKNPYEQGLTAMVGVATNFIICTLSALIILVAGPSLDVADAGAVQEAFNLNLGELGALFIAITLFFFSLTTIVGWYFFAAQNLRFLSGEKFITPFRLAVVLCVAFGATLQVELVWELMDSFNIFLVIPNVIALLYLSPKIIEHTRLVNFRRGKEKNR